MVGAAASRHRCPLVALSGELRLELQDDEPLLLASVEAEDGAYEADEPLKLRPEACTHLRRLDDPTSSWQPDGAGFGLHAK